jgi:hypothetical protein
VRALLGWSAEAIGMSQRTAKRLRRELDGVKGRRGPCFPRDLKERAGAWLAERRAAGATVAELAAELGLASGTVLRWSASKAQHSRALVPVEIVADPILAEAMSVISPSGFRVEGLSFADAVALLKALG